MIHRDLLALYEAERLREREACLASVRAEPELEDAMPDALWKIIVEATVRGDRQAVSELIRVLVQRTKHNIIARIRGQT